MIPQTPLSAQPHHPVSGQSPRRRRDRVRQLLSRMRDRGGPDSARPDATARAAEPTLRRQRRKRKAALALSVGAMGLGTAAMAIPERDSRQSTYANASDVRHPASELTASASFREALIEEEGVRKTVYLDAAGLPTVGVGHLVTARDGLRFGERIGYDRILKMFDSDLSSAEAAVLRLVGDLPLFQHEFDALVDLVYNVGESGVSIGKSPRLNAAIAEADYHAIAAELAYHHAGGSEVSGLINRSERRTNMFTEAAYDDPRSAPGGRPLATA